MKTTFYVSSGPISAISLEDFVLLIPKEEIPFNREQAESEGYILANYASFGAQGPFTKTEVKLVPGNPVMPALHLASSMLSSPWITDLNLKVASSFYEVLETASITSMHEFGHPSHFLLLTSPSKTDYLILTNPEDWAMFTSIDYLKGLVYFHIAPLKPRKTVRVQISPNLKIDFQKDWTTT